LAKNVPRQKAMKIDSIGHKSRENAPFGAVLHHTKDVYKPAGSRVMNFESFERKKDDKKNTATNLQPSQKKGASSNR